MPEVADPAAIRDANETLSRDQLDALQLKQLRDTVGRVLAAQALGAHRLHQAGIAAPDDLAALEALRDVPFTTKADLREQYPFGMLAVGREQLARVHASSGTSGKPTVVAYTRADLNTWAELVARLMWAAGVRPHMTIHIANGYGLLTGGFGFHQGGERIGAAVVPVSGGRTQRQAMLLSDLGSEVLVCTPSYALVIAQAIVESGADPAQLPLRLGLFGGEPWSDGLRAEIERALPLTAINTYGLSEMCGPGVAGECLAVRDGLHVQEDHFLVEVVEPGSGAPVPPGQEGELVFTTLTKQALPLIRYRTGDLGRIIEQPCACGRTTRRITGLRGRRDDMLIVRGVNLHPSEVERILMQIDGTTGHYQLIVERPGPMDELRLECELQPGGDPEVIRTSAERRLQEETGLRIVVDVVEPGRVPRSEGKAVRVVDRRDRR